MSINSPKQLKDWLRNKEKKDGIPANTLINYYMMERLLERIAASRYQEMFIIKGGFLIASMIGVDLRSTMDLDTTACARVTRPCADGVACPSLAGYTCQ